MPKQKPLRDTDPSTPGEHDEKVKEILTHLNAYLGPNSLTPPTAVALSNLLDQEIPIHAFATLQNKARAAAAWHAFLQAHVPAYSAAHPAGYRKLYSILEVHLTDAAMRSERIDQETAAEWAQLRGTPMTQSAADAATAALIKSVQDNADQAFEPVSDPPVKKRKVKIRVKTLPLTVSFKWPTAQTYEMEMAGITQAQLEPEEMFYVTELQDGETQFAAYCRALRELAQQISEACAGIRADIRIGDLERANQPSGALGSFEAQDASVY